MENIEDVLVNFNKQFSADITVHNPEGLAVADNFIIAGMGGSGLAAEIIKIVRPDVTINAHKNYGLSPSFNNPLFIASSYSGNTEETLDALEHATKNNYPTAVISTGGRLLEVAENQGLAYVKIDNIGPFPRFAVGFNLNATMRLIGLENEIDKIKHVNTGGLVDPDYAQNLAVKLKNKIPVIYSSENNSGLAYFWKINFNETAKVPAYYNVFPELNHNEMIGFSKCQRPGFTNFYFIFLKDDNDHESIKKRMVETAKLFDNWGLLVEEIDLGSDNWFKIINGMNLSNWTAYSLSKINAVDPLDIKAIEGFKIQLQN